MKHKLSRIFNKFLTEVVLKQSKEIETPAIKYYDYFEQCDTIQPDNSVCVNELGEAFFRFR